MIEVAVAGIRFGPFGSDADADEFAKHAFATKLRVVEAEVFKKFGTPLNPAAFEDGPEPVSPAAALAHYDYWYGEAE